MMATTQYASTVEWLQHGIARQKRLMLHVRYRLQKCSSSSSSSSSSNLLGVTNKDIAAYYCVMIP